MREPTADFGVIYYIDPNDEYRRMADISIQSLRRHHPNWPVKIIDCPKYEVSPLRRAYRAVSFWKHAERKHRAQQDWRVLFSKASGWLNSPFHVTLYLDVDTIIMRPLNHYLKIAKEVDVVATSLQWKHYDGFKDWQPKKVPMIMSGVVFYNHRFRPLYERYIERLSDGAGKHFKGDQYMFSTLCALEKDNLIIRFEPKLQVDAMNFPQHFGTDDYPHKDGVLDLSYEGLKSFCIFHYNGPNKDLYLKQIKEVWGYPLDE